MDRDKLENLFVEFGKAYFRVDAKRLLNCTTADFEWRQHAGESPTGKILKGVEAVCSELSRRKKAWKDVLYEDFETTYTDNLIVSTFLVSGIDESGTAFKARAVDLYSVTAGKISRKDSYWKQV